jgi:capsular exopolysaccharide synthesis family protein
VLRRRAAWLVRIFMVVILATLVATLLETPIFRATGLIEISSGMRSTGSIDALFATRDPSEEHLRTQFELLRSAALARRVIQSLQLHETEEFAESYGIEGLGFGPDFPAAEVDSAMRAAAFQGVVEGFLEHLVVDPVEASRLVKVSFDSEDADRAAQVVNAVMDTYVAMRVEEGRAKAAWLQQQLDSVRTRLETSENELRAYAAANDLPYLVEEDIATQVQSQLRALRERLTDAQTARFESESVHQMVSDRAQLSVAADDRVMGDLMVRLAELRREYARLSATFTDDYPETAQLKREIAEVERLVEQEQQRLVARVEGEYRIDLRREDMLRDAVEEQEAAATSLGPMSGTYHLLRQAVLSNRALHSALQEKRREAEVFAAMEATDVALVDRAVRPLQQHSPVLPFNLALGVLAGVVLGLAGALLREWTDDTVHTEEDTEVAGRLPVLALIPKKPLGVDGRWPRIDQAESDRHAAQALADAFGALRTAVLFTQHGRANARSILVSSCRVGEGKTTVSVNLSLSLAGLGYRVLLVDADMRRPSVHRALGVPGRTGLLQVLRDGVDWSALVLPSEVDGLCVLPAGGPTHTAGDLLAAGAIEHVLREAESQYDFVIVDAPALFINAYDARVLAQHVCGVLVVVRSRSTPRALVNRIPGTVPNVIGVVMNDLRTTSLPDHYREYFAGYGPGRDGGATRAGVAPADPRVAHVGKTEPALARIEPEHQEAP